MIVLNLFTRKIPGGMMRLTYTLLIGFFIMYYSYREESFFIFLQAGGTYFFMIAFPRKI